MNSFLPVSRRPGRGETDRKKRQFEMSSEKLTQEDIRKIEEEIEYRKLVVRPKVLDALREARAQGDLSENFEYYAAKRENGANNSRIRYLERMLKTATVITDNAAEDEIGLNTVTEIYFEEDDETETYKIVTSVRGNSLQGRISIESPLGKALLGHKAGDRVHVVVSEDAAYDVIVRSIRKVEDDGSDELRSY